MDDLRLIIDPPSEGPMNMAIDEALLESAASEGIATLRLYQWNEPTLSLGYFQAVAERQSHQASVSCPLVRRATGGGAILHDRELTYSLAIPQRSFSGAASKRLYELCHVTLISLLNKLGVAAEMHHSAPGCDTKNGTADREPFLCFQRRTCFDVVASGAKIVGSAQRRRRGAVLQHGSILLSRSTFAPELPGIEQIAGSPVSPPELIDRWPARLAENLQRRLVSGSLTAEEAQRSKILSQQRFAARDWLYRR